MLYLLLFYVNSDNISAPLCYLIRPLLVLLNIEFEIAKSRSVGTLCIVCGNLIQPTAFDDLSAVTVNTEAAGSSEKWVNLYQPTPDARLYLTYCTQASLRYVGLRSQGTHLVRQMVCVGRPRWII